MKKRKNKITLINSLILTGVTSLVSCQTPYEKLMANEPGFTRTEPISAPTKDSGYLGHNLTSIDGKIFPDSNKTSVKSYQATPTYRSQKKYSTPYEFTFILTNNKIQQFAGKDSQVAVTPTKTVTVDFPKPFYLTSGSLAPDHILPDGAKEIVIIEEFHTGDHTLGDELSMKLSLTNNYGEGGVKAPIFKKQESPGDLVIGVKTGILTNEGTVSQILKKGQQLDLSIVSKKLTGCKLIYKSSKSSRSGGTTVTYNIYRSLTDEDAPAGGKINLLTSPKDPKVLRKPEHGSILQKGHIYSVSTNRDTPGTLEEFASIPMEQENGSPFVSGFLLIKHEQNLDTGPTQIKVTIQYATITPRSS